MPSSKRAQLLAGQSAFAGLEAAALFSCESSTALSFKERDCEPSRNRLEAFGLGCAATALKHGESSRDHMGKDKMSKDAMDKEGMSKGAMGK